MAAQIESGYATLDAAWAAWGAEHATVLIRSEGDGKPEPPVDLRIAAALKQEAAQWREHLTLKQTSAQQRAIAEEALFEQERATHGLQTNAVEKKMEQLRGVEMEARGRSALAGG